MIAYFNGKFMPKAAIAISPDDRGFLFADGLYEVIRSYGGNLFQMEAHLARLVRGMDYLRLNTDGFGDLEEICNRLLEENELTDAEALIYIQVTRGAPPQRLHHFPDADTPLTVYASAQPFTPNPDIQELGLSVTLVPDQRWARCDLKTVGLTANVLAAQHAREKGVFEALFVRDGCVMEGSKTSFLIVSQGKVVAPPLTNYILGSVTRQVVEFLCGEENIPFVARPIYQDRVSEADELILAGTTFDVAPITTVIGFEKKWAIGPVTRKLQSAFQKMR